MIIIMFYGKSFIMISNILVIFFRCLLATICATKKHDPILFVLRGLHGPAKEWIHLFSQWLVYIQSVTCQHFFNCFKTFHGLLLESIFKHLFLSTSFSMFRSFGSFWMNTVFLPNAFLLNFYSFISFPTSFLFYSVLLFSFVSCNDIFGKVLR